MNPQLNQPVQTDALLKQVQAKAAQYRTGNTLPPERVFVPGNIQSPSLDQNGASPQQQQYATTEIQVEHNPREYEDHQPQQQEWNQQQFLPQDAQQQSSQTVSPPDPSQEIPFSPIAPDLVDIINQVIEENGLLFYTPETCLIENLTRLVYQLSNKIDTLNERIDKLANFKVHYESQNERKETPKKKSIQPIKLAK